MTDAEPHGQDDPDDDDRGEQPLVNPELAPEYLRSLQDGLDVLQDLTERQRIRIRRLERDREVLRERVERARAEASRTPLQRLLAALQPTPDVGRPTGPAADDQRATPNDGADDRERDEVAATDGPTATLPVVGTLGPVRWPAPAPARDLRLGVVADDFTMQALRYEADCLALRSDDGAEALRRERPDVLFVESAYRGPEQTWRRRIARFGEPHDDLVGLVGTARDLDIPTVFWNKEDPVNSDWFTASMGLFDHLFTVDAGLIDHYRQRFGHDRVHVLPFAAQPAIHGPPDDPSDRTGPVLFAGTWFATKHPQRRAQMEMLLDPARPHGLHILDRHAGDDPRFAWPQRFREHIVGSLPYPLAVEATRRYRIVVNVNTVTDSPTMCARRVFELAACATPVVSGPSQAINDLVPADAIRVVHDPTEAAAAYDELLGDQAVAAQMGAAARQWVLDGHTWKHRLDSLLAAVGPA